MTIIKCCLVAIVAIVCTAVILPDHSSDLQVNYPQEFEEMQRIPGSLMRPLVTNLEELELRSANIVRGRILNDARIVWQPTSGTNLVSLEILEVFKGNLRVGDIITLAETYWVEDGVLITCSNYLPSIPHQEYFFFLTEQHTNAAVEEFEGIFWVVSFNRGRFHIPNSMADISRLRHNEEKLLMATTYISNLSLEQATLTIDDVYMSLWQEVIEAYMDWSRPPVPSHMF